MNFSENSELDHIRNAHDPSCECEKCIQFEKLTEEARSRVISELADCDEVFVPISQFPGYSVSNKGSVRSDRETVQGRCSLRKHRPRMLKPGLCGKRRNYLFVTLSVGGSAVKKKVAHLVAEAFLGDRPDACDVDHIDGNTLNNTVGNLRYLSIKENRGRRCRG